MAPLPAFLKTSLIAALAGLAGLGTAAWCLPSSPPPPALPRPARLTADGAGNRKAADPTGGWLAFLQNAGTPTQQIAAAFRLASLTNPAEIRALLDQSHRFPAHAAGALAVQVLLKRWLELEPGAALEYARLHQSGFLPSLLGTWSLSYPAEAEAWILALPGGDTKNNAWLQLCEGMAGRNPDQAWQLLFRAPDASFSAAGVIKKLAAMDLEGTLARLATLPPTLLKPTWTAVARQLMETDPARGWDWVSTHPKSADLISVALQTAMQKDPDQAFAWLATLLPPKRIGIENQYGLSWANRDISSGALAASLGKAAGLDAADKSSLAQRFFFKTATWDPAEAVAFLPLIEASDLPATLATFLRDRALLNGDAALWISGLPHGPLRTAAEAAWQGLNLPEPASNQTTAESLASDIKRGTGIEKTDPRIGKITPAQLATLMGEQKAAGFGMVKEILPALAAVNPAPAAAWLATSPLGQTTSLQTERFSATWAQEDPAAAAAWVTSLQAGEVATTAAFNVARYYQRYAPAEAQAWADALPPGPTQDAARRAMQAK